MSYLLSSRQAKKLQRELSKKTKELIKDHINGFFKDLSREDITKELSVDVVLGKLCIFHGTILIATTNKNLRKIHPSYHIADGEYQLENNRVYKNKED